MSRQCYGVLWCANTMLAFISVVMVIHSLSVKCEVLKLPDTSGIDGQITANYGVDQFFSLWLVFHNDQVKMSDEPFTILAPKNSDKRIENVVSKPELVKKVLLDHVVLGSQLDIRNISEFTTLGGKLVKVRNQDGQLYANDAKILETHIKVPNGVLIVLNDYLFSENHPDRPENLAVITVEDNQTNTSFIDNISQVLSFLKSGVRVFQHFLSRSNVSRLLNESEEYTVFVPTDHAFQRWHPIDWGFYPFSVPEFTENVMINHFVKGNLRQDSLQDGQIAKTLGGRDVEFHRSSNSLTVNGASIVKGDTPVNKGNIMFIGEVLFVSESIVSRLHQQHRDKETPPLLAFPWFGAQFLSHAFLALERDKRFSHITRFLNLADLAPHVSGTGYTFFVPNDKAFEKLGLDKMPDNFLSTGDGLQVLLNHFVKGRLYDRDLTDGTMLQTLGNKTIQITRKKDSPIINDANIVETEVFVYNLGTMFYIDKVLFVSQNNLPQTTAYVPEEKFTAIKESAIETERVPEELIEDNSSMVDVLFADAAEMGVTLQPTTNFSNNTTTIK